MSVVELQGELRSAVRADPRPRPRSASARGPWRGWHRWVSPLVVVLLWQLASVLGLLPARLLAAPSQIAVTALDLVGSGTLPTAIAVSLERVLLGFAAGAVAGVGLALVAGLSRTGENAVDPIMQMLRALPFFGLIPLFILWFGIGETPKVLLVALAVSFPLYLNTFAGIRGVDGKLAEVARTLRLGRTALVRHIVLPGALPQTLVGLRQSLGVAWLALIVAEQVNADAGLGYMINDAREFLRTDVIVVGLLVYSALGLLTDALVRLLERRALVWRREFLSR
ncbi:sulfonate transport system permease protein [Microbispora rosea]|uniref:Sulfonate transport system permease protein n=1 Tax=Microbispora rosea TaxID=58117 RepID=A0A1N6RCN5_9ACTN|nr:ABC transporter permease [Microbispora rosea]GIH45760.1 ABC transporter permease [Microbispora rosea subsp. rosea]SIQ26604.1 sulfonate transport system permease protein [Microbispora rosea]